MKQRMIILSGIFGMLFSAMIILPALGTHQKTPDAWTSGEIKGLLLGILIALAGVITVFCGIKMPPQANKSFTLVEILAVIGIIGVLAAVFLPLL